MNTTSKQAKARQYCANYDNKRCLGVMLAIKRTKSKRGLTRTTLKQWIDTNKANRRCTVEEGCEYFKRVVAPSIE